VFTGRLLRGKGLDTLERAFERLAASVPEAQLVIVGSGAGQALSIEAELRARVAATGLGARVLFAGRVDDVTPWLRAADVFAFPSDFEAMPLSVIEAAACGLPCATTRVGGIPDVIAHERNGLLSAPGDADALYEHLLRLAREPDLRHALGRAARATVLAGFDFEHTVERYRALFHELHARASRPARAR
jgi:glycosyltransferase involved in cell wall biosynthesis